ncbi:PSD1 domain-containing protein [Echinicola sp. CAU 1574]|uniref:PSD1 domain-containing protein n=1 Tax=Echinicola arenosa TaxID=2774144 RepID=A0ABR9AR86_9BACT|nr:PSD1 and planctomycete cytochrome C domain-containing protein [Echinicola arenosa]MBD8491292.1 PSD1 domain-containing protein [Echinicola arenosa]
MFPILRNVLIGMAGSLFLFSCGKSEEGRIALSASDQVSYNFHVRPILSDKCFACHGPDANKREAGLRLDTEEGAYAALKDAPSQHVIVPGDPEQSVAYQKIISEDPSEQMPPPESNLKLEENEIAVIKKWISQGAKYESHWAFVPPQKSPVPETQPWGRNEIDYFTYTKMQEKKLSPNDEANSYALIKRLSLDISGLPPTMEMMEKYQNLDDEKYETLVDDLLNKDAFGEKLAVLWMDISRYADSYGYQDDEYRTQWPYRDWVIHAFNKNMPYDDFITWQLAGDMLPNATKEQILATAFNRNHKYTEEGGVIHEEYRVEYVLDKTNTFSKGILGVTMECAQCHDHKYDPFSQENYYELYAFFNNTPEKGFEGDVSRSKPAKTPILWIDQKDFQKEGILDYLNHQDTSKIMVSVMDELDTLRKTFILDRGVYDAPSKEVKPGTPSSIMKFDDQYSKDRLGLAKWTTNKNNPLTARVFVNLIWQEIFGQGIVKSAGDFGMQGDLPTHPELLDWLAVDFMENGWDIKRLMKQIFISSTYRQSSEVNNKALRKDPENLYLSRAPRLRLTAESVQDLVLASSGLLNTEIGGPSIKPYQPDGLWEAATSGRGTLAKYVQDHGDDLYRRGLYHFIKLTVPPPKAIIFDASNRDRCEVTRGRTNTPLQALVMLNDPFVLEASRVLATKIEKENMTPEEGIQWVFQKVLCREMTGEEEGLMLEYYQEEKTRFDSHSDQVKVSLEVGEMEMDESGISAESAAMMQVIVALYNLEETITKI